jgi:hypothetical protein
MTDSTYESRLSEAINDVGNVKNYFNYIKTKFSEDPELLQLYLPSAKEMVQQYEKRLNNILSDRTRAL